MRKKAKDNFIHIARHRTHQHIAPDPPFIAYFPLSANNSNEFTCSVLPQNSKDIYKIEEDMVMERKAHDSFSKNG